jgi:hypothetical protein
MMMSFGGGTLFEYKLRPQRSSFEWRTVPIDIQSELKFNVGSSVVSIGRYAQVYGAPGFGSTNRISESN